MPENRKTTQNKASIVASLLLAAVFGTAAFAKSRAFSQFQSSLLISRLVPVNLTAAAGATVIAIEAFICIGLLVPRGRPVATRIALITISFFVSYSIWRGYEVIPVPCSCFGALLTMAPYQSIILNVCLLGLVLVLLRGDQDAVVLSRLHAGGVSPTPSRPAIN